MNFLTLFKLLKWQISSHMIYIRRVKTFQWFPTVYRVKFQHLTKSIRLSKNWPLSPSSNFSSTLPLSKSITCTFILQLKFIYAFTTALTSLWLAPPCHSDLSSNVNSSKRPFLTTLFNAATTTTHYSLSQYLFYFLHRIYHYF